MTQRLMLDMRTDEGRVQVSVDLDFLSPAERAFLFGTLQAAHKGGEVGFSLMPGEDDSTKVLQFTLKNPLAVSVSGAVSRAVNGTH